MKKTYYAPTIQTEDVTIGVFGSYGTAGGNGNGGSTIGNSYRYKKRGRSKKWYNFW